MASKPTRPAVLDANIEVVDQPEDAGEDVSERLCLEQIRAEMLRLPDGQREVLLLVAGEGLSYSETATRLGISRDTVISRLSRARQALIERLGPLVGTEPTTNGSKGRSDSVYPDSR